MTDPQELARRYLALWEEYLAALLSDPSATQLWSSLLGDRRPSDPGSEPRKRARIPARIVAWRRGRCRRI